jgi:predicted DNA-binding mobile mystery protein A
MEWGVRRARGGLGWARRRAKGAGKVKPAAGLRGSAEEKDLKLTGLVYRAQRKEMGLTSTPRKAVKASRSEQRKRSSMEEALAGFRMAQRSAGEVESWVKAMRKLVGMPVEELAGRMGVLRWEVYRMERSERDGRIGLWKLRETAKAMDCELVYALVPRAGTLEQLIARREEERVKAEAVRREGVEKKLETTGWKDVMQRALRRYFRKAGMRLR